MTEIRSQPKAVSSCLQMDISLMLMSSSNLFLSFLQNLLEPSIFKILHTGQMFSQIWLKLGKVSNDHPADKHMQYHKLHFLKKTKLKKKKELVAIRTPSLLTKSMHPLVGLSIDLFYTNSVVWSLRFMLLAQSSSLKENVLVNPLTAPAQTANHSLS